MTDRAARFRVLPSVDELTRNAAGRALVERFGHALAVDGLRHAVDDARSALAADAAGEVDAAVICARAEAALEALHAPSLKPVLNLTGTVLHTNLGRAPLPEVALEAIQAVARGASNLEFELDTGRRGDRDDHIVQWLCRLSGAEAATLVNNNAAAVLLCLNTLARRRQVPVSRGELVEIGGAFRMPDIMARAGAKLKEVGTTNRTHAKDYAEAIGPSTACVMKVHTSNYEVRGFTKTVAQADLAAIAHDRGIPFIVDLGAGALVDLAQYGLPHEPTVAETLAAGADLVTFSGDKLLGGPQAGFIVGRADLVQRVKGNPMKRAMRVDKMTLAALGAILPLYGDPARLPEHLPTLRLLTRSEAEIQSCAQRMAAALAAALGGKWSVSEISCQSQIGSGAQPVELLASAGVRIALPGRKRSGSALNRLAARFRALPLPVIGRIEDDGLVFDLRCLEDEAQFLSQLDSLGG